MARFRKGLDEEAFGRIVADFTRPALAVARQWLADAALAEDAMQEAFLRVVRNRRQYDPAQPFSGWFFAVLRNVCRDMVRRQARQSALLREVAGTIRTETPAPSPSAAAELLAGLPRGERDVLVLRILHDLSFADIGSALGISEEAAKKRGQRGLSRLAASRRAAEALRDR